MPEVSNEVVSAEAARFQFLDVGVFMIVGSDRGYRLHNDSPEIFLLRLDVCHHHLLAFNMMVAIALGRHNADNTRAVVIAALEVEDSSGVFFRPCARSWHTCRTTQELFLAHHWARDCSVLVGCNVSNAAGR